MKNKIECLEVEIFRDEVIIDTVDLNGNVSNALYGKRNVSEINSGNTQKVAFKTYGSKVLLNFTKDGTCYITGSLDFFLNKYYPQLLFYADELHMRYSKTMPGFKQKGLLVNMEVAPNRYAILATNKYLLDEPDSLYKDIVEAATIIKEKRTIKGNTTFDLLTYKKIPTSKTFLNKDEYLLLDIDQTASYVSKANLEFIPPEDKAIDKAALYKPDVSIAIKIRKILNYGISEFLAKFKAADDIYLDVEKYLKEYVALGINYDKVTIVLNFLNDFTNHNQKVARTSNERKLDKELRTVKRSLEDIKFLYIIRPDDYVQVKSPHERSGHWRNYKSGKSIWVPKCKIHRELMSA